MSFFSRFFAQIYYIFTYLHIRLSSGFFCVCMCNLYNIWIKCEFIRNRITKCVCFFDLLDYLQVIWPHAGGKNSSNLECQDMSNFVACRSSAETGLFLVIRRICADLIKYTKKPIKSLCFFLSVLVASLCNRTVFFISFSFSHRMSHRMNHWMCFPNTDFVYVVISWNIQALFDNFNFRLLCSHRKRCWNGWTICYANR